MLQFDLDELFENLIPPEKLQKLKSSSVVHQIKLGGVGGEPKQTQKTSGIQTPPLTPPCPPSPPVESNKLHDESLSELSTEDKELVLSIQNWVTQCQPGEAQQPSLSHLPSHGADCSPMCTRLSSLCSVHRLIAAPCTCCLALRMPLLPGRAACACT